MNQVGGPQRLGQDVGSLTRRSSVGHPISRPACVTPKFKLSLRNADKKEKMAAFANLSTFSSFLLRIGVGKFFHRKLCKALSSAVSLWRRIDFEFDPTVTTHVAAAAEAPYRARCLSRAHDETDETVLGMQYVIVVSTSKINEIISQNCRQQVNCN